MAYDFRKKGVSYLVEAAGKLRQDLYHGGSFWGCHSWRSTFPSHSTHGQAAQAFRHGDFSGPTTEPEEVYHACDVFILPTFYDACSLVVLEALPMAAGLPAITTVFNGAAGIITEGRDGLILKDPRNTDEMSAAMQRFLDRNILQDASAAANLTASNYTIERNHHQMINVFRNLHSGKND